MAKDEIVEKLRRFLELHNPISEECHVVYLMVQIRKILDHKGENRFPLLRFYSDWTVHTAKDRITPAMRAIMNELYASVKSTIENGPMARTKGSSVTSFAYMRQLQVEAQQFTTEHAFNSSWPDGGWVSFVQMLVRVLANQPMKKPTAEIEVFSFVPAAEQCVGCIVKFATPICGHDGKSYDHFRYYNAY